MFLLTAGSLSLRYDTNIPIALLMIS